MVSIQFILFICLTILSFSANCKQTDFVPSPKVNCSLPIKTATCVVCSWMNGVDELEHLFKLTTLNGSKAGHIRIGDLLVKKNLSAIDKLEPSTEYEVKFKTFGKEVESFWSSPIKIVTGDEGTVCTEKHKPCACAYKKSPSNFGPVKYVLCGLLGLLLFGLCVFGLVKVLKPRFNSDHTV
ncbi:hypothetical protein M3Y97_00906900 [Aphelenchoides bicaudatus]|nr:hypothetical protein M3Y97_00906900 [Aphelenchoides bicaudatus]